MKYTKNNYGTKTITPHSLYLDYIKKVILEMGNFTKWSVELPYDHYDYCKYADFTDLTREILCSSYARINLSDKKITIVEYSSGYPKSNNLSAFLKNDELLSGLTLRLNDLLKSSNKYDFIISLKKLILDGFNTSLLEVKNSPFSDQEEIFKTLTPITMFKYVVDPKYKESKYIDNEMLEILRTLLSKENIEASVMNRTPELLSRIILRGDFYGDGEFNERVEYYLQLVPKELILKSFSANLNGDLQACIQDCQQKKDLYNFLFVDNDISTDDEILGFKEKFVGTFFIKRKGPQSSNFPFLRNEVHDGKEFYSLNDRFLYRISNIQDECQRLNCKHIDEYNDRNSDISDDELKKELEDHYEKFKELQFVFSKALTFLSELDDEPVVNVNAIDNCSVSKYNFDINEYYLSDFVGFIKTLKEFFIPVYKNIHSQGNINFVFNEDDDHLSIFYNTKGLEKSLKENDWCANITEEILLELEQLFNNFSEIISEENRQELELFQMDLELWKKKVAYFKKVQKKEVYRFVKDKG
jgi:hypothetical protein